MLTCSVKVINYLTVEPTVHWSGGSVGSGNGVMVGDTTHSGVISMRTLTFSPLCTSYQGTYSCQAIINIPSIGLVTTRRTGRFISFQNPCKWFSLQISFLLCTYQIFSCVVSHPTVTISRSRDGPVYAGTTFQLRVDISFNDLTVDIAIGISWNRQNDESGNAVIKNSTRTTVSAVIGSGDSYTASLTYTPITISDSGNITTTVSVSLPDESTCVQTEVIISNMTTLHVEGDY